MSNRKRILCDENRFEVHPYRLNNIDSIQPIEIEYRTMNEDRLTLDKIVEAMFFPQLSIVNDSFPTNVDFIISSSLFYPISMRNDSPRDIHDKWFITSLQFGKKNIAFLCPCIRIDLEIHPYHLNSIDYMHPIEIEYRTMKGDS